MSGRKFPNFPHCGLIAQGIRCWKFRIFQSFRLYVKSILENAEVLKLPLLPFKGSEFCWLGTLHPSKIAKIHKKPKLRDSQCVKMAYFALLETPKLISRKVWGVEKLWNFHTVREYPSWRGESQLKIFLEEGDIL